MSRVNSNIGCAVVDYRSGVLMRETELHGNSIHMFAEVQYILHSDYIAWHFLPTMCSGCVRVRCCVTCQYGWIQGVKPDTACSVCTPLVTVMSVQSVILTFCVPHVSFCQKPSSRRRTSSAFLFQRRVFLRLELYRTLMDALFFRTMFRWLRNAGKGWNTFRFVNVMLCGLLCISPGKRACYLQDFELTWWPWFAVPFD